MNREAFKLAHYGTRVVAATAYARSLQYQDARVAIEREAGKMLLAA
jgi:hypothetical protein